MSQNYPQDLPDNHSLPQSSDLQPKRKKRKRSIQEKEEFQTIQGEIKEKTTSFDKEIAKNVAQIPLILRRIREIKGYTQEQLARILDVSFPTINSWERGGTYPFLKHYRKIMNLYKEVMEESNRFYVFIVEDDEDSALVLEEYVKIALPYWKIKKFQDGYETLLKIGSYKPHIVLLDIMMPGLDGIEVFKRIKGMEELRDTCIIFVTAVTDEAILKRAQEVGAFAIIQKPYDQERMISILQEAASIWG